MITEIIIQIAGGFFCAGIGYLCHSVISGWRLRRIEIESWRAARIYYTRRAAEAMERSPKPHGK